MSQAQPNNAPGLRELGAQPLRFFMSGSPACIASHRTLADAWKMMQHEHVRHLPVLEGGVVVGMISQRDLGMLGTQAPARLEAVPVQDAMSSDPYVVGPDTALRAVIGTMSTHRLGAAIVVDGGLVVGVFTTTDALAVLRGVLEGIASPT